MHQPSTDSADHSSQPFDARPDRPDGAGNDTGAHVRTGTARVTRVFPPRWVLAGGVVAAGVAVTAAVWVLTMTGVAYAAPASLGQVITNLRDVIIGLAVGLATLFLTIGGVRLMWSGGDPGEAEAGKKAIRYAAYGYGLALLAPVLVTVLRQIVGA